MAVTGQFVGEITGTNHGFLIINIDKDFPGLGFAIVHDISSANAQPYCIRMDIKQQGSKFEGVGYPDPEYDAYYHLPPLSERPGLTFPERASFAGVHEGGAIAGTWKTDIGTGGEFKVANHRGRPASPADKNFNRWADFKAWATEFRKKGKLSIFRGQSDSKHKLRTSFHRTGQANLVRYQREQANEFQARIADVMGIYLKREDPLENGALLALAQHHGFPTPLLDWTTSPYVAAYFAYEGVIENEMPARGRKVRVFALSHDFAQKYGRLESVPIAGAAPVVWPLRLPARSNPRLVAQQGCFTMSTIDDIEWFVSQLEQQDGKKYLHKVDLAASCAGEAMDDLFYMGVSAQTLFPGLDGIAKDLKHRMFYGDSARTLKE